MSDGSDEDGLDGIKEEDDGSYKKFEVKQMIFTDLDRIKHKNAL